MIILGIETSCDETGVALCSNFKILSSYTKTQSIHQKYGGVVPEIASREHEKYLPSITKKVLEDLKKGRTLKPGESALKGAADMAVNSPERVSNYI